MIQVTSFQSVSFLAEVPDTLVVEDFGLFRDDGVGVAAEAIIAVSSISTAISSINVTFVNAPVGQYYVLVPSLGKILASFEVVQKLDVERLKDIEDEALGSWSHDKGLGTLTLFRQDGTVLATYNVVDSVEKTSREVSI